MENNKKDKVVELINFHCPRYNELPTIPLYKEQVITFIEEALSVLCSESSEKLLTSTMVNNYVKQKVVSPPKDKKYNQTHVAYLIVVCILKQVFTLTEVCRLIRIQIDTCSIEHAYDRFCMELECALKSTFTNKDLERDENRSLEAELVRSAAMSFANKLYIQKYLDQKTKR